MERTILTESSGRNREDSRQPSSGYGDRDRNRNQGASGNFYQRGIPKYHCYFINEYAAWLSGE